MKLFWIFNLILVFSLVNCKDEAPDNWKDFTPFVSTYNTYQLPRTDKFNSKGVSVGLITGIEELSGLAESNMNKGTLWAHNDSGNTTTLYLLDETTAATKASYQVEGVSNEDWEDMATGPGPATGVSYIYMADIGDNKAERQQHTIYRFPEPLYAEAHAGRTIEFNPVVDKIIFSYPDEPHNAETVLLDPLTRDLYIVTKYGTASLLFVARYPQSATEKNILTLVGTFPFREATGGSVSSDGSQVLIKTYDQIFYWSKKGNEPLWKLLSTAPELAPYDPVELKGEAIAWTNGGYYTASEKDKAKNQQLYLYR